MSEEFTAEVHGDPDDYMVVTKDLVEELAYQWGRFDSRQSTPTTRASSLIELSNRISDPRYDIDAGEIVSEGDDNGL